MARIIKQNDGFNGILLSQKQTIIATIVINVLFVAIVIPQVAKATSILPNMEENGARTARLLRNMGVTSNLNGRKCNNPNHLIEDRFKRLPEREKGRLQGSDMNKQETIQESFEENQLSKRLGSYPSEKLRSLFNEIDRCEENIWAISAH